MIAFNVAALIHLVEFSGIKLDNTVGVVIVFAAIVAALAVLKNVGFDDDDDDIVDNDDVNRVKYLLIPLDNLQGVILEIDDNDNNSDAAIPPRRRSM